MTTSTRRIAERPRDIADCVSAFLQAGNMEGIASMFHPDCRIYFPPDQPPSEGHAGVHKVFAGFIDDRPSIQSEVLIEVIVGDTALLCANWRVVGADGAVVAEGQSTEVAKKLDHGGWAYLIDCPLGLPMLTGTDRPGDG